MTGVTGPRGAAHSLGNYTSGGRTVVPAGRPKRGNGAGTAEWQPDPPSAPARDSFLPAGARGEFRPAARHARYRHDGNERGIRLGWIRPDPDCDPGLVSDSRIPISTTGVAPPRPWSRGRAGLSASPREFLRVTKRLEVMKLRSGRCHPGGTPPGTGIDRGAVGPALGPISTSRIWAEFWRSTPGKNDPRLEAFGSERVWDTGEKRGAAPPTAWRSIASFAIFF